MEIYLQTSIPNDFFEINQYLNLKGIYFDADQAIERKADIYQSLMEFLEFMTEDQELIIPVISGGFRNQLDEIRLLSKKDPRFIFVLPPLPDGLMCSKACKTLKIPTVLGEVISSDQLILADNLSCRAVLSLDEKEFHGEGKKLLKTASAFKPDQWIITGIHSSKVLDKVIQKGLQKIVLDYKSLNQILYNPASKFRQQELKEEWLVHFISPVFALETKEEAIGDLNG